MQKIALAFLSFGLCGLLGCNQIADINDPIPKEGSGGTSAGQPGTDPSQTTPPGTTPPSGGDTSKFVGTWSGNVTTAYTNCTNAPDGSYTDPYEMKFTASSKGLRLEEGNCGSDFTVSGDVASVIAGAECRGTTNDGYEFTTKVSSGTFTLASSTTATAHSNGTITYTDGSCDFTITGQLTKKSGS